MQHSDPQVQRLLDESAIRHLIAKYPRALDRHDTGLLASMFHPDAIDEHGPFSGKASDFVAFMAGRNEPGRHWMHHYGNQLIEFASDTIAHVETYCLGLFRMPDEGGAPREAFLRLRYLDKVEKRGGEWKIAHRKVVFGPCRIVRVEEEYPTGPDWIRDDAVPADAVYNW